ncbi:MAG: hypothetical protein JSV20_08795 [Candidatus Bathyarchaeota archaeon]|nr:MAG: hypothetical protein JSV20_08795 [Candidatus Bathyarchaeota archaeon]
MVKVRKRNGKVEEFDEGKIVAGVKNAGATLNEADRVTKEVASKIVNRIEITADELTSIIVKSLTKINKVASEKFVKYREKKIQDDRATDWWSIDDY